MSEKLYCIVNNSVDSTIPVEGLTGMTIEQAETWMIENNTDNNFSIEKDNWQEQEEE